MEVKQLGLKSKQAEARAERERQQSAERAAVLEKYGSEEAATAPCERECTLNAATAHLARTVMKTFSNGTFPWNTLDGWSGGIGEGEMPASVIDAVTAALPMPTTIREAKAEHVCWRRRDQEIDAIYGFAGDMQVGLAAQARWELVRKGYEQAFLIRSLDDLHCRLLFAANSDWKDEVCDAGPSILDAFERLVLTQPPADISLAEPSNIDAVQTGQPRTTSERRDYVVSPLSNLGTTSLSDREIGRRAGVSPTTVGTLRRKMSKLDSAQ